MVDAVPDNPASHAISQLLVDLEKGAYNGHSGAHAFGERYLDGFLEQGIDRLLLQGRDARGAFDITILSVDSDLSKATKRGTLVADRLVLSHVKNGRGEVVRRSQSERDQLGIFTREMVHRHGPSAAEIGRYLLECLPLLRSGQIVYSPNLERVHETHDEQPGDPLGPTWSSSSTFSDLVVEGRRVIEKAADSLVRARLVEPVLVLDLPTIEGTSLADFCKISIEESEALNSLQSFLRQKLLDLDSASPDISDISLAKITTEIKDGIRGVRSEMRRISRRAAVQQSGAAVATVTAAFYAIAGKDLSAYLSVLGTSGGLWGSLAAAEAYVSDRDKLRERPAYFLWLLSRQAK